MPPKIFVTKPYLPPIDEFLPFIEDIWRTRDLTNSGKFHKKLEDELASYLGVSNISLCSNGTIALILALRALEISGEVITTPYSFVATSHSLVWNGLKPIFADLSPNSFNLDPHAVEKAITEHTTAILAVHCYGYPANVDALETLASRYKLKLIYDAAHAFGVKIKDQSILNFGDISILSFHATKVFNTFEGGAVVCNAIGLKDKIDSLKNFGFLDEISINNIGINGKMAEINAALGLAQLPHFEAVSCKRASVDSQYRYRLKKVDGITLFKPDLCTQHNYAYFPILVDRERGLTRDSLFERLKANGIMARRYFYPLIPNFEVYKDIYKSSMKFDLVNANYMADRILCLPIYPDLKSEEIDFICNLICNE